MLLNNAFAYTEQRSGRSANYIGTSRQAGPQTNNYAVCGKPQRAVHPTNSVCDGSQARLDNCVRVN